MTGIEPSSAADTASAAAADAGGTSATTAGGTTAPDAAILLGGGRASRLGGTDKPAIVVGGRPLADHAFDAVRGCRPVIAVGPESLRRDGAVLVREDPPFGGPVAALAAGLDALCGGADHADDPADPAGAGEPVEPEWVLLLACDLPRAAAAVETLRRHPPAEADGIVLVDEDGRQQWLAGRYRVRALRAALAELGEASGASMRRLAASLELVGVPDPTGASVDLDTWDDIRRYREGESGDNERKEGATMPDQTTSPEDLDRWVAALGAELGVDVSAVPIGLLLDTTRDVAHGVARPAGPLSTFVIALAAARDGGTAEAIEKAAATARALAQTWAG